MNCPAEHDLDQLANTFLNGFDQRVAQIPGELCAPFFAAANQLTAELAAFERFVAMLARCSPAEALEDVSRLWSCATRACDLAITRLKELHQRHPHCGAEFFYDTVLDLRNRCDRLQTMHS